MEDVSVIETCRQTTVWLIECLKDLQSLLKLSQLPSILVESLRVIVSIVNFTIFTIRTHLPHSTDTVYELS